MKKTFLTFLGIGFLLLSLQNPMLFIFPMWIFVLLFKPTLEEVFAYFSHGRGFIVAGLTLGLLTEIFAILNNLDLPPDERILLHPEPIPDLIYALFYYTILILTWYLLLRKIKFSKTDIFLLTGIFGIFTEEVGAVFLRIFSEPITGLLYALIIVFVYGIFPMLAYMITEEGFSTERSQPRIHHYLLAALALFFQYAIYGNFIYTTLEHFFGWWFPIK